MAIIDTVDAREDVAVLFLSYLGRAPEYQAMNFYVTLYKQLAAAQGDNPAAEENAFKALSAQIYLDAGNVGEIPSGESVTDAEYVDWIYQNVLGRAADEGGRAYWIAQLGNGSIDRAELVGIVIASAAADARDGAYLANRTTVALEFAKFENSNPQILPTLEFNAAQVLDGVNEDPASIDAAKEKLSDATNGGQTFFLTPGVDKLVGTAGNDVFNALPIDPATGDTKPTLGAFDSIDGGAGRDTLNIYTGAADNNVLPGNVSIKNIEVINLYNANSGAFTTNGSLLDASKFAGVEELWQHGKAVNVTALAETTVAGFKNLVGDATVSVAAAAAATTVGVKVDGADDDVELTITAAKATTAVAEFSNIEGAAAIQIEGDTFVGVEASFENVEDGVTAVFGGKALDNVALDFNNVDGQVMVVAAGKVLGNVFITGELAEVEEGEEANKVILSVGTEKETFTLSTQVATDLRVRDVTDSTIVSKVKSIDASTSTGDISLTVEGSVATVSTGAGDDTILVERTGAVSINAGAGDDVIVFDRALVAGDRVNGGEGFDTLVIDTQVALVSAGEYNILKSGVTNIDNLVFANEVEVDAARLSTFSQLTFQDDSIVKNASATQVLVAEDDLEVIAAGYKGAGTFGGAVTVEVGDDYVDLDVYASTLNLRVEDGGVDLTGDLQVANVELVTTWPEDEMGLLAMYGASFYLDSTDAASLTTLTVTGSGYVEIDNGDWDFDGEESVLLPSALVTIDLSGLDAKSELYYWSVNELAESISLGAGSSSIYLNNSTVEAVDTLTGLKLIDLTAELDEDEERAPYDELQVRAYADGDTVSLKDFVKVTVTETADFDLALTEVAAKGVVDVDGENGQFVFTFGGDTYVYANIGEATLDDTDVLVKIVGEVNLDHLVNTLNDSWFPN